MAIEDIVEKESVRKGPVPKDYGDLLEYYHKNFEGYFRNEVREADGTFYNRLLLSGLIEHIPLRRRTIGDAREYYMTHYKGMQRAQLKETDRPVYNKLSREGLLHKVPSDKESPLQIYLKHYRGMPRGTLLLEEPWLYWRLRRAGQMRHVPTVNNVKKNPYIPPTK